MSGLRPSTTGLYSLSSTLYNHPTYSPGKHKTLHQYFKEQGYTPATVGKVFHNEAEVSQIAGYVDHRGSTSTDYGGKPAPKLVTSPVSESNGLVDRAFGRLRTISRRITRTGIGRPVA